MNNLKLDTMENKRIYTEEAMEIAKKSSERLNKIQEKYDNEKMKSKVREYEVEDEENEVSNISYIVIYNKDSKETIRKKLTSLLAVVPNTNKLYFSLSDSKGIHVFTKHIAIAPNNLPIFNGKIEDAQVNYIYRCLKHRFCGSDARLECFDEAPIASEKETKKLTKLIESRNTCEITFETLEARLQEFKEFYSNERITLRGTTLKLFVSKTKRYYLTTDNPSDNKIVDGRITLILDSVKHVEFDMEELMNESTYSALLEKIKAFINETSKPQK